MRCLRNKHLLVYHVAAGDVLVSKRWDYFPAPAQINKFNSLILPRWSAACLLFCSHLWRIQSGHFEFSCVFHWLSVHRAQYSTYNRFLKYIFKKAKRKLFIETPKPITFQSLAEDSLNLFINWAKENLLMEVTWADHILVRLAANVCWRTFRVTVTEASDNCGRDLPCLLLQDKCLRCLCSTEEKKKDDCARKKNFPVTQNTQ